MGKIKNEFLEKEFIESLLDPETQNYFEEQDDLSENTFIEDLNNNY